MRYIEFEFEFDALYPQAGSRSSCESTAPLILKCACEWLYFWLSKIGPSEGTHEKISGLHPFHGAPTGTRDPQRTKSILHFPPSCFHTIDDCALIGDGFQFHRNQHREVERVKP